jgi:tripeptide aminopeptidase
MNSRVVRTFLDMVQIDSPTGEEDRMVVYLRRELESLVNVVTIDQAGNIYARLEGSVRQDPIFLSAHLDTVEPGRGIKPKIKNGWIRSDGSTILGGDDKVGVAAILEALRVIREQGRPYRTIEVIFTRSEEVGNYGALGFDYGLLRSKMGFCFDSSHSVGTIITSSPYYERFDLTLIGKEAHASRPELATNVLPALGNLLSELEFGFSGKETLFNIGVVSGGFVRNTIPGKVELKGEIRSLDDKKILSTKRCLTEIINKICAGYGLQHQIEFVRENGGYVHRGRSEKKLISQVEKIIQNLGVASESVNHWGVSDANIFNHKNLTCFNMGIGVVEPHTLHERVKISELNKLVRLIVSLAKNLNLD